MTKTLTVGDLPQLLADHARRLAALEQEQRFLINLLALSPYAVRVRRVAIPLPRRPVPRPRQGGHL